MRTFLSGAGLDVTTTVKSYLIANREFQLADLYLIGELEDPQALFLTNWPSPLNWPLWGTFNPAVLKRDKVTSQVGLSVAAMSVEWSPPVGSFTSNLATTSPYQLARLGFFDNKRVRIWRTVMPTAGDANTYGACEWFFGWVGELEVKRTSIKFNVNSYLSALDEKVPQNVIEPQNTRAQFAGATPVTADSETSVPTFTVAVGSSADLINGITIQPTPGKIYGGNKFQFGFLRFLSGSTLAGAWSGVASSGDFNAGGGVHYNQFRLYDPFDFDPTPGDTFYVSTQAPTNAGGFIYVPDPEVGGT